MLYSKSRPTLAVTFLHEGMMPMSQISVNDLTFSYDTNSDPIFQNVSFQFDTDWKLGFIGRNGRGKTTFLKLLLGEYPYSGTILSPVSFEYFPFPVAEPSRRALEVARDSIAPYSAWERELREYEERLARREEPELLERYGALLEQYRQQDGYTIDEQLIREAGKLEVSREALERPFDTLSHGERTKLLLAALFLKKHRFLLIDEPTNHLDLHGREVVAGYLAEKSGFLLVSHDRAFLDRCVDHILSLNRSTIEVQRGNFSSWQANREKREQFELEREEQLRKEISQLRQTARQKAAWSDRTEKSKIGSHAADRGFIGHKAAKMMKRAKAIERRRDAALEEKEGLLQDREEVEAVKLFPLEYPKERLAEALELSICYTHPLFESKTFAVRQGERIALTGRNGCGKSSLLRLLAGEEVPHLGELHRGSGLRCSYVPQDTSFLRGKLRDYAAEQGFDESLFLTILRKLDFSRVQFEKDLAEFSGGQKKKVLIAGSLCRRAHLYLWDEPLNFIDVLSRMQIEQLLLEYRPTIVFIEHDREFCRRVATRTIPLDERG